MVECKWNNKFQEQQYSFILVLKEILQKEEIIILDGFLYAKGNSETALFTKTIKFTLIYCYNARKNHAHALLPLKFANL